jgi:hypothetical protein
MQAHQWRAGMRCSGFVDARPSRSGEIVYALRLRIDGRRPRVTLGTAREGWTREAAEEKLRDTLGALRAGVPLDILFPPDDTAPGAATAEPTLGEVMDDYLADRRGSVSDRTLESDRWAIAHLRLFWGNRRPSEVTPQLVDRFRRKKLAEAEALRARLAAGERPVEECSYVRRSDGARVTRRQPRKPLGPRSINSLIAAQDQARPAQAAVVPRGRSGLGAARRGQRPRASPRYRPPRRLSLPAHPLRADARRA